MTHWLTPPLVTAPSGANKLELVNYKFSAEFFEKSAYIKRRSAIFQLWTHVVGSLPPINAIAFLAQFPVVPTITTLHDSVACFKGVNRPYDGESDGNSVLTYILNLPVSIAYEPHMVCVAKAVTLSKNLTATVQVRLIEALLVGGISVTGQVTRIEFVPGTISGNTLLPERYSERYRERLW